MALHEKVTLPGPKGVPRNVRIFRCSAAKSHKGAREAADKQAAKAPMGSGAKGGWLQRQRAKQDGRLLKKEARKEAKQPPKLKANVASKLKKERKEKLDTKRRHKQAKRSGGAPQPKKSAIGKKHKGPKGGKKATPGKL